MKNFCGPAIFIAPSSRLTGRSSPTGPGKPTRGDRTLQLAQKETAPLNPSGPLRDSPVAMSLSDAIILASQMHKQLSLNLTDMILK